MKPRGRFRRPVVRGGRRYAVCGLRSRPSIVPLPKAAMWLPGATLLLVLLFSAYVIGRPPAYPATPADRLPVASLAHYTLDDFANASR